MNLKLSSIADAGSLAGERAIFKADAAEDIGDYAVFECISTPNDRIAGGNIPHVYWFVGKKVGVGDFVVLYSKEGVTSEKKNKDGTTSHFFYWGLKVPVWVPGRTPVLVSTPIWTKGAPIKKVGVA
jgi:hypothetical protein